MEIINNKPPIIAKFLKKITGTYRYITNFNFISKSKKNVAHHYDISEKLYDLFLDSKRQYSCAYFKNENDDLETAQTNKINHIIKKLNLKSNGRCGGTSNLYFENGNISFKDLLNSPILS